MKLKHHTMRLQLGVCLRVWWCIIITFGAVESQVIKPESSVPVGSLKLPEGFRISVFRENLPNARSLTRSKIDEGGMQIVYVSTNSEGKVYAVIDNNNDGVGDDMVVVLSGLQAPMGIVWHEGSLFVGLIDTILRYDDIDKYVLDREVQPLQPITISKAFPSTAWHGWKYISIGPDNKLYVPVGAPCNVCECEKYGNISYCSITRMNLDGSDLELFATGLRNSVGFDWHPQSGAMFFTDNGQDDLGSDKPDCELNTAPQIGLNFGFPYCHAVGTGPTALRDPGPGTPEADPNFNTAANPVADCSNPTANKPPVQTMGPHTAPLGMRFYTGDAFPAKYNNSAFIALHGSHTSGDVGIFNGYSVVNVALDEAGNALAYEPFIFGWFNETKQEPWGRPVDVMPMPDGAMLISDDKAGVVYRVTYDPELYAIVVAEKEMEMDLAMDWPTDP